MSYDLAQPRSLKAEWNLRASHLFVIVLMCNLLLMWLYNEHILTREVYHNILSEQLEAARIDQYFEVFRNVSQWGYLAQPLLLWIQIAFIALLIQMPLLLAFIEIPFKYLFRIVTWASLLMVGAGVVRWLWLMNLEPGEITNNVLATEPLSINHLLDAASYPHLAYATLGKFNVFELGWCVVLHKGLVSTGKIKPDYAALLIGSIWILLLLFQWGLGAYFEGANA